MGRRDWRAADRSGSDDTGDSTIAESPPPSTPPATAEQPSVPKPAEGFQIPDPFPAATHALGADRLERMVWVFLALGIAVRTNRFLLDFPLWRDESFLAQNYLDRSFLQLMQPLDDFQIAPILYLWLQQAILKLLGFSESTLRLLPFLCGVGSLFLFRHLAGCLLRGSAYLLAFGTFAVAYPLVRYSGEAKPYGSDMFVSLLLFTLAVQWCRQRGNRRWWWALTLALPPALALSYPAVFVAGGIAATMAAVLWRRGTLGDWLKWGVTCAAIGGGFAAVYFASARAQMACSGQDQQAAFAAAFPPLDSLKNFALFVVANNTSESMAYPIGGDHGASALTTLFCLTGLAIILRGRRFSLAVLCTAPLALSFLAAVLHRYPYGNHVRFSLFMAPIVCLLAGLGAAACLSRLKIRRGPAARPLKAAMAVLALIAAVTAACNLLKPYKEACWQHDRDFARWLWCDMAQDAELVCYVNDLHGKKGNEDLASIYYCNQRIYSARLAKRQPAQLDRVSKDHPLRVARLHGPSSGESREAEFRHWLQSQEAKYRLVACEKFPITIGFRQEVECVDEVELYEFVPK